MNLLAQDIAIWYKDKEWKEKTFQKLIESIPNDAIYKIIRCSFEQEILLKDGSRIRMLKANDTSRGQAVGISVMQKGISFDVYMNIIRPCTKPFYTDAIVVDDIEDYRMAHMAEMYYMQNEEAKE